jgi:hypothetical protein
MRRVHILIEIESKNERLPFEILEAPKKINAKTDLPGSAVIMKVHQTKEGKELYRLGFGANVPPELLANWLYKKIKGRTTKLLLDRKEVEINKSEIEMVISEKIGKK